MFSSRALLVWTRLIGIVLLFGGWLVLPASSSSANGTVVEVSSISLSSGETGTVEIAARRVTDPRGLAAYQFDLEFDPTTIQVDSVRGGEAPFDSPPTSNVDNNTGQVRLTSFHLQDPGPTGDVMVAHLDLRTIGTIQGTSMLDLSFEGDGLINPSGEPIPAEIVDGAVTINSSAVSDPATPAPTTTPTPTVSPSQTPTAGQTHRNQGSGATSPPAAADESQLATPPVPPTSKPDNAGGSGGGGAVAPTAAPAPVTAPQTQGTLPSSAVPTPTLTAPAVRSGQGLPVSPNATPMPTPDALAVQKLEFSSASEATPAPPPQPATPVHDSSAWFPWWGWLLIGLVTVAGGIWGGIFYAHLKGRRT